MAYLRFKDINLGGRATDIGAVRMHRPWVRLASTGAPGKLLARKVR